MRFSGLGSKVLTRMIPAVDFDPGRAGYRGHAGPDPSVHKHHRPLRRGPLERWGSVRSRSRGDRGHLRSDKRPPPVQCLPGQGGCCLPLGLHRLSSGPNRHPGRHLPFLTRGQEPTGNPFFTIVVITRHRSTSPRFTHTIQLLFSHLFPETFCAPTKFGYFILNSTIYD